MLPPYLKQKWIEGETDPKIFIETFLSPKGKVLSPNAPQLRWLLESSRSMNFWQAGNSTGKSFGSALKHIWYAAYKKKITAGQWRKFNPGQFKDEPYETVITAPDYKMAMAQWQQVEGILKNATLAGKLGFVKAVSVGSRRDPHARIELWNGSLIHAISLAGRGKHIEGQAYDLITVDEPADELHLEHVVERVLVPRLFRRGGTIDLVGTPKGVDSFWDYWRTGMPRVTTSGYPTEVSGPANPHFLSDRYSLRSSSRENPYAAQEKIEEFARSGDKDLIAERIEGMTVDRGDAVFPWKHIEQCFTLDLEESEDHEGRFEEYANGHIYVGGADFGQVDSTVFTIIDRSVLPYRVVVQEAYQHHSWEYMFNKFYQLHKDFKKRIRWQLDATGMGGNMQEEWTKGLGISYRPYKYTPVSKLKLINRLQDGLATKKLVLPEITDLKEELRFYKLDDDKLKTDRLQSLALAYDLAEESQPVPDPYTY